MATAASLLTKVETAIETVLDAIANDEVEELDYNGRRYRRYDFPRLLDSLQNQRATLKQAVTQESRAAGPVRFAGLRRAR